MARRNVMIHNESKEQDPIETQPTSAPPAAQATGAGEIVMQEYTASIQENPEVPALLNENEDSGIGVAPDVLRQMAEAEEQRRDVIREFIVRNLKSGTDYGTIMAGRRESKPSLFKP